MDKMVDNKMTNHQARGPVFLPDGKFPNYRTLVTDKMQPISAMVSEQLMASPSAQPKPIVSSSAHKQPEFQPRILTRPQPQHLGQNIPQVSQEQISAMFNVNQPIQQLIPQIPMRPHAPIQQHQPIDAQFIPDQ